ncbi:MAG: lipid-A-disaccharide synthase, partial [Bryobacteraceae bacterium]
SAGEASGDLYAAALICRLRERFPTASFFGCAGPRMQQAGVRAVVDASSLAVVGLAEVLVHIPRIYGQFRRLLRAARREKPDLAILTDSPDFHLRLALHLKRWGIPVVYLVAPQVWAWRKGRLPHMRNCIDLLLCIFPFEEEFFRRHGLQAHYIGHPLATLARPTMSRDEFFARFRIPSDRPLVALLPGSRRGEAGRHLPVLIEAVQLIRREIQASFVWATPHPRFLASDLDKFREPIRSASIQLIEGFTWDVLASADLALVASGTATIEAALLGVPMVVFYKVSRLTWLLGRPLVRVPFYSMVNLVAGRAVVPELIQNEVRGERLAAEALRLLRQPEARSAMRRELAEVAAQFCPDTDPMLRAAA